ncbi:hypothetical protein BVY01_00360 [bacterium I07]|nr:hypothetical protein BVY01_00360 [bacterium I07]
MTVTSLRWEGNQNEKSEFSSHNYFLYFSKIRKNELSNLEDKKMISDRVSCKIIGLKRAFSFISFYRL